MTKTHDVEYKCPYCGGQFTIEVYDAVDVKNDEDLRDRCVSGDIFRHECPHCHKEFLIQNNLLYTDPVHKFVIWVSAKEIEGIDLTKFSAPLVKEGYTLRRCETVKEFAEKIQVLEDGVDDIAVELAKYDCFIEFVDNKKEKPEDVTGVEYQRTENEVMKINVRTNDRGMAFMIPLPMLEDEMAQSPERYKVENEKFPLVNSRWIVSLFQND